MTHTQTAASLIERLQAQLMTLADHEGDIPVVEIERAAKAITQLVRSLGEAESYLAARSTDRQPGHRPPEEDRIKFLRKLKRLVDRGILKELDEIDG